MEGHRNLTLYKTPGQEAKNSEPRYLARQPGWGGGSPRAFRRVEVIVDAVLFESCVGGVAVAMTFASFFRSEF